MAKRILVVEDEPAEARLVKSLVELDGHNVTVMGGTLAALDVIDTGDRFDLYIVDIRMPQGEPHGVSFANMLERRHHEAPIIFVTGNPRLTAGTMFAGQMVLAKPLDCAALRNAVSAKLTGQSTIAGKPAAMVEPTRAGKGGMATQ
jgi:CheY-like chemotaxis protein